MKLDKKLQELCDRRDWSQSDLARKLGARPSTVHHWFSGRSRPSITWLLRIARVLGVPLEYLVDDAIDGPPAPDPAPSEAERQAVEMVRALGLDTTEVIRRLSAAPLDNSPHRVLRTRNRTNTLDRSCIDDPSTLE